MLYGLFFSKGEKAWALLSKLTFKDGISIPGMKDVVGDIKLIRNAVRLVDDGM